MKSPLIDLRKPLLLALLLLTTRAWSFDVPAFNPNVVDAAHVLSTQQVSDLNQTITQLRAESHIYAAVLLIDTTDTDSIEQAATKTFDQWQLGQSRADNGLLIIAAIQDRHMRIEVGYGLEGSIPDVQASRIIRSVMTPAFKQGDYFTGIDGALKAANDLVLHGESIRLEPEPEESPFAPDWQRMALIWVVVIVVVPILFRAIGVWRASYFVEELQPTSQERSWSRIMFVSGPSAGITLFLLINPGIFFILFSAFAAPLFIGFAYIFLAIANRGYLAMYREKWRRRFKTKPQPKHGDIHAQPQAFDSDWNNGSSSSSSRSSGSSNSSSSSSSSGGGRSGGGGASGSW